MRNKILRGVRRSDLKKLDSFTLEMPKNHLIRSFLRNGRLRVNQILNIKCRRLAASAFSWRIDEPYVPYG